MILVDANLRRPALHTVFGLPNDKGLMSLLSDRSLPLEYVLVYRKWKIVPGPSSLAWNVYYLIWETRRYAS